MFDLKAKHLDNRIVLKAECNKCARSIERSEELVRAVVWGQGSVCKDCNQPLEIIFGNTCRHHGEDLSKGYCNGCVRDELMDNQI